MQRPEDTSRNKRGKDEDRFYCPCPGCTRSFAELWRLKVHYRAPPDVRGSGKERGHGTELQFCPKCGKELKPGKHHVGCFAGRAGPRQPVKRAREVEADVESKDEHAELSTESARQRTRTGVLPDIKFEDVIPRAGSLNQFSEEAASLTRSGWHGEHAAPEAVPLVQDLQTQAQQQSAESELLDTKSTDQFLKYQQMLPSLRRPSRSLLGLPSGPSPPPSPPGGLDPELTNIPPLFDFNLFNPERARGRNARLPAAVTSTLHSPSDAADDMVLQALLDPTSIAASSASQLASAESVERQQLQNTLAHQRIEQVAASAHELLRFQGPSFPHSAPLYSSHFPSPPQNLFNSLGDAMSRERTLASLLQQPNQLVSSLEHYELPGSGRPGRLHGQQQSRFQSPQSGSWINKPVPSMRQADFGSGLSPLPSPPALLNTQQRPHTPGNLQSLLPWDFNRWGGLPIDVEANVAQGFRLREQQWQQQQQQQQQAQQQAQRTAESEFQHQNNDFSFPLPLPQSGDPQRGGHHQLGSQFQYNLTSTSAGMTQADQYGVPEALGGEEGGNEAFLPYSRRLMRQEGPERQPLLPWAIQVGLFCKYVCLCHVRTFSSGLLLCMTCKVGCAAILPACKTEVYIFANSVTSIPDEFRCDSYLLCSDCL
ncbi:TPA: hypothetical protein ACH3X1_013944 [Trebouxia sp. C0004]